MSPWPLKNGCGSTFSTCSQGVSAAYGKWGAGTAERYKETLWYSALSARPYRPDDCEYKAPEIEITQRFSTGYPLQHGAESGLSDCQQRASALLLPHRLRAQQLYFSAGYTRVSKLIGGATNSFSLISSHHIPCVICGRWCSHCPHLSRMSPWRSGNVVFPAVGKDNEAGIIICSFHTVGIAVGRAGLVSYHGFGWQHTFQFVGTGFSIYHGLPQRSLSAPCWRTTLFIGRSPVVGP